MIDWTNRTRLELDDVAPLRGQTWSRLAQRFRRWPRVGSVSVKARVIETMTDERLNCSVSKGLAGSSNQTSDWSPTRGHRLTLVIR